MCGWFTQYHPREKYLSFLGEEAERDIPYDPEPVGRYNVALGARVSLLSERRPQLQLDPVHRGYAPGWRNKPALINARSETATGSRMFGPLWEYGRVTVFTDGWFEWKQQNGVKQPFFIYHKDGDPLLLTTIGKPPFENGNDQEDSPIVTAAADEGLLDIHDRRPLAYPPVATRKRPSRNTIGKKAEDIACEGSLSVEDFTWHPASRAVGNPRSQGRELTEPLAQQTEIHLAFTHRVIHRFCGQP